MASMKEHLDFVLEQLSGLDEIRREILITFGGLAMPPRR